MPIVLIIKYTKSNVNCKKYILTLQKPNKKISSCALLQLSSSFQSYRKKNDDSNVLNNIIRLFLAEHKTFFCILKTNVAILQKISTVHNRPADVLCNIDTKNSHLPFFQASAQTKLEQMFFCESYSAIRYKAFQ